MIHQLIRVLHKFGRGILKSEINEDSLVSSLWLRGHWQSTYAMKFAHLMSKMVLSPPPPKKTSELKEIHNCFKILSLLPKI